MTAESKTIRITCRGAETLLLETLFEFQPDEFKDLTKENFAALRHTILTDGFQFVFSCWRDATGKTWIIDGHQRKRVLKKLAEEGYTIPPLPVAWIEAESATKAAEALIRQNARYGTLDDGDQLAAFVAAHNVDWNAMLDSLGNTGLGELKIQEFDAGWMKDKEPEPAPEAQIDRAEELQKIWRVKRGDLWRIGEHRLLCGDSTSKADVARVMGGEKAAMAFQDPPYALFGNSTGMAGVADDKMIRPFFRDIADRLKDAVRMGGHVYSCCDWHSWSCIFQVFSEGRLVAKNMIVWDKVSAAMGQGYRSQHELLFFGIVAAHDTTKTIQRTGNTRAITDGNVWQFGRVQDKEHNAQKPVELVAKAVSNSSDSGDVVVDLFLGSGTTLVACEQLGRKGRGIEIEPKYVAVTLQRLADMGLKPELLETSSENHTSTHAQTS